jgi:hypothetical protein
MEQQLQLDGRCLSLWHPTALTIDDIVWCMTMSYRVPHFGGLFFGSGAMVVLLTMLVEKLTSSGSVEGISDQHRPVPVHITRLAATRVALDISNATQPTSSYETPSANPHSPRTPSPSYSTHLTPSHNGCP